MPIIVGGAGGGVTAHGDLTGLTDDDHTQYQKESEKGAANGYASLGADSLVPQDQLGTGVQDGSKFLRDDGTWQSAGGGVTDADYLVGTAHAGLSAEIVVGTSPGGELGGTWASPTVDATHSGSTHSAATDTHIADTADAHDASAISILDTAADFDATDVEGALAELQSDNEAHVAAADPHTGYVKESDANWIDLTDTGETTLHSHPGGAGFTAATQAEQEAGTDVTKGTTPGRQHFHPSAAKFWVKATGNSTTIEVSYNMTSWADTAIGIADGTIATDFSSVDWVGQVALFGVAGNWNTTNTSGCGFTTQAAGTFTVTASQMTEGGTAAANPLDPVAWFVDGFGDL